MLSVSKMSSSARSRGARAAGSVRVPRAARSACRVVVVRIEPFAIALVDDLEQAVDLAQRVPGRSELAVLVDARQQLSRRDGLREHREAAGRAQLLDERADDVARLLAPGAGLGMRSKPRARRRRGCVWQCFACGDVSSAPALRARVVRYGGRGHAAPPCARRSPSRRPSCCRWRSAAGSSGSRRTSPSSSRSRRRRRRRCSRPATPSAPSRGSCTAAAPGTSSASSAACGPRSRRRARLVAAGGTAPIFEATFDHDGVSVRVDVLDRSEPRPKIIEVKSSVHVKEHYLDDCAIQAWALVKNGLAPRAVAVATLNPEFVYAGDNRYEGLLVETDVSERVQERLAEVDALVTTARRTLAELDEPAVAVGTHCGAPHGCEFYAHCAPPAGKFPVLSLGGSKENLFELIHAGYRDLRDVPEAKLESDTQRRIWQQSRLERPYVGAELRELVRSLAFPRYYLDFETLAPAVPIFAGTRPFEALPFQWSCHIETSRRCDRACRVPRPRRRAADAPARREPARDARHDGSDRRLHAVRAARAARARRALRGSCRAARGRRGAHRRSASADAPALLPPRRCRARGRSRPCCRRSRPI